MPVQNPIAEVLARIYENQIVLEAPLMELTLWVEQGGSAEVGENVRGALNTIDQNAD